MHLVNNALDVERREAQESALTKRGANVPGDERPVIAEGLRPQSRPGGQLEPAVEVLVQGQILSGQFPALVAFFEPVVQVVLCGTKGAMDGTALGTCAGRSPRRAPRKRAPASVGCRGRRFVLVFSTKCVLLGVRAHLLHTTGTLASRICPSFAGFAPLSTDRYSVRLLPKQTPALELCRFETGSLAADFVGFLARAPLRAAACR